MTLLRFITVLFLISLVSSVNFRKKKRTSSLSHSLSTPFTTCHMKYPANSTELSLCLSKITTSRTYNLYLLIFTFLAILLSTCVYFNRQYLFPSQNHILASFYNRHSKLPPNSSISHKQILDSAIHKKRKILRTSHDIQKSSSTLILKTLTLKINDLYQIEMMSTDEIGEFEIKGYLWVGEIAKLVVEKKYKGKKGGKDLLFEGEFGGDWEWRGEWYYDRCFGKAGMSGKWRTESVKRVEVLFRQ